MDTLLFAISLSRNSIVSNLICLNYLRSRLKFCVKLADIYLYRLITHKILLRAIIHMRAIEKIVVTN